MIGEEYSKDRIIKLVIIHNQKDLQLGKYAVVTGIDYDEYEEAIYERIEYQFNVTRKFLGEKRIAKIFEQKVKFDQGDYFYNKTLNLSIATGGQYDGYNYNYLDAIFFAVLVSLFNHPYLSKIRNKSKTEINTEEELDWIESYKNELEKFVGSLIKSEKKIQEKSHWQIGVIIFNLESLLYKITLLNKPRKSKDEIKKIKYVYDIQGRLLNFFNDYTSLSFDDQIDLYNNGIKNRLKYAQNLLEERFDLNDQIRIKQIEAEKKEINKGNTNTRKLENRTNEMTDIEVREIEEQEFEAPPKQFTQRLNEIDDKEIYYFRSIDDLDDLLSIYYSDE